MEEKNPIQVADRLFGVVEFLADRESSGLMEIASALELNKSTAHRILTSLQYMGYVRQTEEGKYVLTMKIVELSGKVMSRFDIIGLVRPYLKGLMELTGETVHFVKRDGNEAIYIDKVEARSNTIQMVSHIGSRIPLYCSGVGKAMAATFSSDEVRRMWKESDIKKLTPNTITDYLDFEDTLARVREEGYAIDDEENQLGVRCVAADLSAPGKPAEYALSISAPVSRMDDNRLLKLADYMIKTRNEILETIRPVL